MRATEHRLYINTKQITYILREILCGIRSRDGIIVIATGYGLEDRRIGVRVPVESRIFSSPRRSDRFCGPPNLLSNGLSGTLSPGVKRPGCEADHSPPASTKVKRKCGYIHPIPRTPSWRSA
jgi:hypothetical protein